MLIVTVLLVGSILALAIPRAVIAQGDTKPLPEPEKWADGLMASDSEGAKIALDNWTAEQERLRVEALRKKVYIPSDVIKITDTLEGYKKEQMYNCYNFVKPYILVGYGDAKNHPAPEKEPMIGDVVVTYESSRGHYGKVLMVFENEFVIGEFNYVKGFYTERVMPKKDRGIKGFFRKIK